MTDLERYPAEVVTIGQSSFCPAHFKDSAGKPRWDDLAFAVEALKRLQLDPVNNIGDTSSPRPGQVDYMAEIQRTLARRHNIELEPLPGWDATRATWRGRRLPDGEWKEETFTWAMAQKAALVGKDNYAKWPERMMLARSCTLWISLHAPEVLRELPEASRLIGLSEEGGPNSTIQTQAVPDLTEGGSRGQLLHTVRRDEPAVSPERIANLKGQINGLSMADQDSLRSICKSLRMPNIDSAAFTLRDAALLHRLIGELQPDEEEVYELAEDDPTRPFTEE